MSAESHPVLVVDDDPQLARTVSDILRLHGYVSLTAGSGAEGLQLMKRAHRPVPVALVDLNLPDMNGLDLVDQLQESPAGTEVVILTGHASVDTAVAALRGRSRDYLIKPVAPRQLLDTVDRGVRHWNHQRAEEALRKDRARFQLLVESLSDIVAVVTGEGVVEYMSPSTRRILGHEPAELAGDALLDHVHSADRRTLVALLAAARSGAGEGAAELHLRHADGSSRLMECVVRRLPRPAGESLVVTCRDVTERRRLEEDLLQSQKLDSIGRLAGGVAHDFNNQLTAIMNSAELASWVPDVPAQAREELSEIRRAAERAANLTRQLLIFSRKDVTDPRSVRLNDVVTEMMRMLRRLIPADVELDLSLADEIPPVLADRTQLEQVVMNLVLNARDALPDGGRVELRTRHLELTREHAALELGPGSYAVLEVADEGEGMPEEVRERVFEPFFTTKEQGRGTGLGLSTCYGIVKQNGGAIQVRSELGEGTVFQVILPTTTLTVEEAPRVEARAVGESGAGPRTILVVDDDQAVRRVVVKILARRGYEVLEAASGPAAIHLARGHEGPIHLLVSDLIMPEMKGPEVARRLQVGRPEMRVLFMSGYADDEVLDLLAPYSASDLLEKPAPADALVARVEGVLAAEA